MLSLTMTTRGESLLRAEQALARVTMRAERFDFRTRQFAVGRSLLALAQALALTFTAPNALLVPVIGQDAAPRCSGLRAASAYCVADDLIPLAARHWMLVALFLLVASGVFPRYTGPLHAWLAYSFGLSISLPDGGDSVAWYVTLFILPLCLADGRRTHWHSPARALRPWVGTVAFVAW